MTVVISVGLGNRRYARAYRQADTGQVPNRTPRACTPVDVIPVTHL